MKRIMTRSFIVWFVTIAFFIGVGFMTYKIVSNSSQWALNPLNMHLPADNDLSDAGEIVDRNGEKLAYSDEDGKRHYHDDADVRESLLHVVGDSTMNISTAIQSRYRSQLYGYNYFLGLGVPDSLSGKTTNDLKLTVDADACAAAYNALGSHKGCCVVYNYKTGEVLCDVSSPSYDPADPPTITEDNEEEYDGVYLDNVISSTYTPGSTFKIITATAAIENIPDIYDQTFTCYGSLEVEGNPITCESAHGTQTFKEAFANSCNCAFAQIAMQVGAEKMKQTAEKLGFNNDGFSMSAIPIAQSHYDATGAGENYLAWSGIGQYEDLANPMLMAMICSSVANGGAASSPYIVEDDGKLLDKLNIEINKANNTDMMTADTASKVRELMTGSAESYRWRGVSLSGLDFCAKTGTAEVGEDDAPTAWFVGFTNDDAHPYAFAAVVVEGGYGIDAASPVVEVAISELVE